MGLLPYQKVFEGSGWFTRHNIIVKKRALPLFLDFPEFLNS